jgi:MoaA/NifB/PqqE/SkfB family radical SAM enzyme
LILQWLIISQPSTKTIAFMKTDYQYLYRDITNLYSWLPRLLGGRWAFPPIQALLELTYRCNQRCAMCQFQPLLERGGGVGARVELTTDEVKHIIAQLPSLALITLTGGEPLLRADLGDIVKHATKKHIVQIITNGTLLTVPKAHELLGFASRGFLHPGLFAMGISVQGLAQTHDRIVGVPGSFAQAIAGVKNVINARRGKYPLLSLKTVITPDTLPELPSLYRLAQELGVEFFNPILENTGAHFERVNMLKTVAQVDACLSDVPPLAGLNADRFAAIIGELLAMAKGSRTQLRFTPQNVPPGDLIAMVRGEFKPEHHLCNVFWNALYINAYGDFMACASQVLGNLRRQSLKSIWHGAAVQALRLHRHRHNVLPGCSGCCYLCIRSGHSRAYDLYLPK